MPHFVKIGFIAVEEPQSGATLGHNGGEWLVDLMGDRRGEFAHRRQPRHSFKVGPSVFQRLLAEFAFGDVNRDCGEERRASGAGARKALTSTQITPPSLRR